MASAFPPQPPPRPPARPLWQKVSPGCLGLVALVGVTFVVLCGSGVYWVVFPGRQLPTQHVVGPSSGGVVLAGNLAGDRGAGALVGMIFEEVQRAQNAKRQVALPPLLERFQEWNNARGGRSLLMYAPRDATLSYEPLDDGRTGWVAGLNFRLYSRPMRAMFEYMLRNDPGVRRTRHRGHSIFEMRGGPAVCFAAGTVVVAERTALVQGVLDRAEAAAAVPALPPALAPIPGDWDIRGAMSDPARAATFHTLLLPGTAVPDGGVGPVRFGIDAQSAERVHARAELVYSTPGEAAAAGAAWEQRLAQLVASWGAWGLKLEAPPQVEGQRLIVDLHADGLRAFFARALVEAERQRRQAPAESDSEESDDAVEAGAEPEADAPEDRAPAP